MRPFRVLCALALLALSSTPALAQGSANSSLAGVVLDTAGGVVPGATITVKNNATSSTFETVSNTAGAFSIPVLDPGTYTVTVALDGFKTAVINDVRLLAATPGSLRTTLEVGNLEETVEVRGGTELVQTQSSTVSSTITTEQITNLPLVSRNALNFVVFLPGVETSAGPRGSTISGLPQNTISVTYDGVNVNNNFQSGDGFFSMVTPRLDAVEEVTVTGATPTADQAALGAVQIAFVTRSGTNNFDGSLYHYFRHPELNSNYYFNQIRGLERNDVVVHQYGGRVGGPIVIPGLFDGRNKAFFFFNMEEFYQPTEASRTRTILHPRAQEGWFRYNVTVGGVSQVREVNLLTLAQQNNQLAALDPVTRALLTNIRSAAGTAGTITELTNPNTQQYFYQSAGTNTQHSPTGRVDVNLSSNHRFSGSYSWGRLMTDPDILNNNDAPFPGFPVFGRSPSYRTVGSTSLRSTLSPSLVNELRGGWQWSPLEFSTNVTRSMFDQQGGFGWSFTNANMFGLTSPGNLTGLEDRNTTNWNIDNTLNWLRGTHSVSLGGTFMQVNHVRTVWSAAPQVTFGTDTNFDPANAMFTTANLPGASTQNITDARALYGLLTGRLTAINGTARLSEATNAYEYLGSANRAGPSERGRILRAGLVAIHTDGDGELRPALGAAAADAAAQRFVLDVHVRRSVRPLGNRLGTRRPGLQPLPARHPHRHHAAVRAVRQRQPGLRHRLEQLRPERRRGVAAQRAGRLAARAARRPGPGNGPRRVLGRVHARAHGPLHESLQREPRRGDQRQPHGKPGQPGARRTRAGRSRSASRTASGLPASPQVPPYPLTPSLVNGDDINIFDPAIKVPNTRSWSVGVQRAISDDMAVDVRYVGTRLDNGWTTENWNEINVFENGFLNEFTLAQANLRAHVAAGCGTAGAPACSFAYRGPGTGTSPLPTYLAYFAQDPRRQGRRRRVVHRRDPVHQQRLDGPPRRVPSRIPWTPAPTSTPTPRSAPTRWRRACRRTSSE